MLSTLFLILFIAFVGVLWLRFAPIDRDDWHVDPAETEVGSGRGVRLIGLQAPRYPAETETVLANFQEIVLDDENTRRLEGDLDEGMITFVARSRVLGLAEVITAKAVAEGHKTKLSIASRPRFPLSSRDAAAERLDRWLQEMRLRLGEA